MNTAQAIRDMHAACAKTAEALGELDMLVGLLASALGADVTAEYLRALAVEVEGLQQ